MADAPSVSDRVGPEIPGWLTSFVGRQGVLAQVRQLLTGESRVVTLCGLGGAGKSRLAAELAGQLAAGRAAGPTTIWWVPLASVSDPASVPTAVAGMLRLAASAGSSAEDLLVGRLSAESALLVLDNCEQVAAASAALVSVLVAKCPQLRVLTTSRSPLGLSGEQVFPVPPMTAADGAGRSGSEAVELFVRRARLVAPAGNLDPEDPAIAELCDYLAGLPLAIELAASWTRLLSPAGLLLEIKRGEEVLVSDLADLPDRHRNLMVMLDSTWRALDGTQQRVLARLGIFTGSFTQEAAEVVAGASLNQLRALVEASLIQRIPDGATGARFRVHELIGSYALRQAAEADPELVETAQAARFDYLLGLVERAASETQTPGEAQWLGAFDADLGNIDAAITWALDRGDPDLALRISGGLFTFWVNAPVAADNAKLVDRALAHPPVGSDPQSLSTRAQALDHGGYAALGDTKPRDWLPDIALARARFAEEFALWQQLGDEAGMARSLRGSAHVDFHTGDWAAVRALIERSLAVSQAADDRSGLAWSVNDLADWHDATGHPERAEAGWRDALGRFDQLGVGYGIYRVHLSMGILGLRREDWALAGGQLRLAVQVRNFEHFVYHGSHLLRAAASLATALRRSSAAAELFGAASTWEDTYGVSSHDRDVQVFDAGIARCRRQLAEGAWGAGYRTGACWTSAEAMQTADRVLEELAAALSTRPAGLTQREVEVLRLVAVGLSNDDIAQRLVISPRTVHTHIRALFAKLGVSTRTAAAHEASLLNML
jgi:predicted ATPase/DNA-binding CsgD family transcriptional regulator